MSETKLFPGEEQPATSTAAITEMPATWGVDANGYLIADLPDGVTLGADSAGRMLLGTDPQSSTLVTSHVTPTHVHIESPILPLAVYRPGMLGWAHTRGSGARYTSAGGVLISEAPSNALRDSHYIKNPLSGVWERTTLLEDASANTVRNSTASGTPQATGLPPLWGRFLSSAAITMVVNSIAADPRRPGFNRLRLTVTNNDTVTRQFNLQASCTSFLPGTQYAHSWTCKRISGSVVSALLYLDAGFTHVFTSSFMGNEEFTVTSTGFTTPSPPPGLAQFIIRPPTGESVTFEVVEPQIEQLPYATSHIATSAGEATRAADTFTLLAQWPSQPVTQYIRYVDLAAGVLEDSVSHFTGTQPQPLATRRAYTHVQVEPGTFTIEEMRGLAGVI